MVVVNCRSLIFSMESMVVSVAFLIALSCDEGSTEGAHDTGDIRTDGLAVGDLLKASENGVVVEGTALDNDVFAELGGVGNLDNLITARS